jgi:hypothetical protein
MASDIPGSMFDNTIHISGSLKSKNEPVIFDILDAEGIKESPSMPKIGSDHCSRDGP